MRRILSYSVLMTLVFCSMWGCITPYQPPFTDKGGDILVVDGMIIEGESKFTLSKTISFNTSGYNYSDTRVRGARVWVENEQGQRFEALPQSDVQASLGEYVIQIGELNPATRYRLRISADGEEYESTYRSPQGSSSIDKINFRQKNEGAPLEVTVDVTGDNDGPRHYLWKYEETWEVIADVSATHYMGFPYNLEPQSLATYVYHVPDPMVEPPVDAIAYDMVLEGVPFDPEYVSETNPYYPYSPFQYCWRYDSSKEIILGSASRLTENKLVDHSVYSIDVSNERLSYLYHTKIIQYGLGDEAFTYMTNQRNNTHEIGSIFAPMPAEMPGNIVCTTSP